MIPITDHDRCKFMDKLAEQSHSTNGLALTDWENNFVASFRLGSNTTTWFTQGRREATDRLRMKYGSEPEINMPHPRDLIAERPKIADADPTGCQYLVKNDAGNQIRCNEAATCREPGHLRYCDTHGQAVVQAMKRSGEILRLIAFK